jgi:hypothetical protein
VERLFTPEIELNISPKEDVACDSISLALIVSTWHGISNASCEPTGEAVMGISPKLISAYASVCDTKMDNGIKLRIYKKFLKMQLGRNCSKDL